MERRSLYDDMAVDIPEGVSGGVAVKRITVQMDVQNARLYREGRGCLPGVYTALYRNGELWMSDTTAERRDHFAPARQIDNRGGEVLTAGLGLGMILRVALLTPGVTGVDVIEIDHDVIALVGPHYERMAAEHGKRLTIHEDDATTIQFPRGQRWSVAWFDIWPELCGDNLPEMSRLRRIYGQRSDWNDCWGRTEIKRLARRRLA